MINHVKSMGWLIAVDVGGGLIALISLGIIPYSILKYAIYAVPLLCFCILTWCHLKSVFKEDSYSKIKSNDNRLAIKIGHQINSNFQK